MSQNFMEKELQKLFKSSAWARKGNPQWKADIFSISGPLAARMLGQAGLDSETATPFNLLDSGCGSGIVADCLQGQIQAGVLKQSKIICGDISQQMVDVVNKRAEEASWVNTEARVIDAQDTGLDTASFTHVTMNIGFHVVPDSEKALDEALRLLKPGGTLALTTWHRHNSGWGHDMQQAVESFPFKAPFALSMQTTRWGDWGDVNWLERTLEGRGLQGVEVDVMSHLTRVENAAAFVSTYGMMIEWIMNSQWSEELRKEHGRDEVFGLVRDFLAEKYEGKPWHLTWTSIIASGRVPE